MEKTTKTLENRSGFALITGGSHGIGKAVAAECARNGFNIIIVALEDDNLEQTVREIRDRFPVQVIPFPTDLRAPESAENLYNWCNQKGYEVRVLVNNVGLGYVGPFVKGDIDHFEMVMDLNMYPMVRITHRFLPRMLESQQGFILNVGSMASFHPVPYKSVYAASKGFVHSFSRGLREELVDSRVSVSTLFPPPVETNPRIAARIREKGWIGQFATYSAEDVARFAIRKMLRKKYRIVPGFANQVFYRFIMGLPNNIQQRFLRKIFGNDGKIEQVT